MKQLFILPILLLLFGCASTKTGSSIDVRKEVSEWSYDIGSLVLVAKPEYRVPMAAAVAYLDAAENAGSIDLGVISGALAKIESLQSKDSKLGIIGGRLILRRALGDIDIQTPELMKNAGLGLRDGLKQALGQ
jgi:hypothetical protein